MNHGDHGDHGGHGGMPMGPTCSMNMLWNTQIVDTCIVFPQWHISSTSSFVLSFLVIVALSVFYEYLRAFSKSVDLRIATALAGNGKGKGRVRASGSGRSSPNDEFEEAGLLSNKIKKIGTPVPPLFRITRAALYGATVFLSFFLMLVFMTYNAYLILAVVIGASLGHYIFGARLDLDAILLSSGDPKGLACH